MGKPEGRVLRKSDYSVRPISLDQARHLIETLHYAKGGSNTRCFLHGLFLAESSFWDADCIGVAWWIPPTRSCAEANYDGDFRKVLTLSRLAIAEGVPTNAATFLVGRSIRLIRQDQRFRCLLTYADEWQGHTGAIYRALNFEYLGLTSPQPIFQTSSGVMVARKAGPKTRTRAEMEELGHSLIGSSQKHRFRLILKPYKRRPTRGGVAA